MLKAAIILLSVSLQAYFPLDEDNNNIMFIGKLKGN